MVMKMPVQLLLMLTLLGMVGCGGGSGGGSGSGQNSAPVAISQSVALNENTSKHISLAGTDIDGDDLVFSVVSLPIHGTFSNSTYVPNQNYRGDDSFTFVANDGFVNSTPKTVQIVVNAVRPTVSISKNNQGVIDTTTGDAVFSLKFSEDVTGLSIEDFVVTGGSVSNLNGVGSNYSIVVTPNVNSKESIQVSVVENGAQDSGGDGNRSSNKVIQSVNTQLPFITKWKTDNRGRSNDRQIKISTFGGGYDYRVDWGDGIIESHLKGDRTHTYDHSGEYTLKITGDFPRIYFSTGGGFDNEKLLSIEQWGTIQWSSMERAFFNCYNLIGNAIDKPDLSNVTNMSFMLSGAISFNQDIGDWDTKNVINMSHLFYKAASFNQAIGSWDTSKVENMMSMFELAQVFDQDLNQWNTSKVNTMASMFKGASKFNGDISSWNMLKVNSVSSMFRDASSFNQDIGDWDTKNIVDMGSMFRNATAFNKDIGYWHTSNVEEMSFMFNDAKMFNQNISEWDTINVVSMFSMFRGASSFEQNISSWNISKVSNMEEMFLGFVFDKSYFNLLSRNWPLFNTTGAVSH